MGASQCFASVFGSCDSEPFHSPTFSQEATYVSPTIEVEVVIHFVLDIKSSWPPQAQNLSIFGRSVRILHFLVIALDLVSGRSLSFEKSSFALLLGLLFRCMRRQSLRLMQGTGSQSKVKVTGSTLLLVRGRLRISQGPVHSAFRRQS